MPTKSEDNGNLVLSSQHFWGKMDKEGEYKYSTKIPIRGEAVIEYHRRGFVTIERAVNKLVVLISKEEAE